jgi:hypothetical protein
MKQLKKYFRPNTFEERIESELMGLLGIILSFSVVGLYMLVLLINFGSIIFSKQPFLFCWVLVQGIGCLYIAFISAEYRFEMKKAKNFPGIRFLKLKFYKVWFICFAIPYFAIIIWLALQNELLVMFKMSSILLLCFGLLYFSDWKRFQKQAANANEEL